MLSQPELPYAGTSGHSGTNTSRERARQSDSSGQTGRRQKQTLNFMFERFTLGVTWKELSDELNLHHGSASGVLSVLHLVGKIERLAETRNRCKVYVLPDFVQGRATEARKQRCCPHCGGDL